MRTPMQALRQRRKQRQADAHTVAAVLAGGREMYVYQLAGATDLPPKRLYRALNLMVRSGRALSRKGEEGFPRRRLHRLASTRHAR